MKFPYSQIFSQAFWILKTNRFLWIWGLALVWGYLPHVSYLNRVPMVFLQSEQVAIWICGLGVLILILYVYFRARASLILGIKALLDKQPVDLGKSWRAGRSIYSQLIKTSIILQTSVIALSALMVLPVCFLWIHGFYGQSWAFGIVAAAILIPLWLLAMVMNVLADVFIGTNKMTVEGALRASFDLVARCWRTLLMVALILIGLTFAALLISVVPAGLISLIFVILGRLAYHNGSAGPLDLRIITTVSSFIVFWLAYALISVFHQVVWILAVGELNKPVKIEDEELAELPEVAS